MVGLSDEHLEKLFYFSLKRTGNRHEAEELAQEIAYAALKGLSKNLRPMDFDAWLWGIARNQFANWSRRRRASLKRILPGDPSYALSACAVEDSPEDLAIYGEQFELLRRELSLLAKDHRDIIVAYYIRNEKIGDIASKTGLPEGTVKHRLYQSRRLLKEGMSMARTLGQRSFNPENVRFLYNRSSPTDNVPQSLTEGLIPKNILLEAYNNPCSAEDLALSLGIALPYMEDELKKLTEGLLIRRFGDGRYVTDFIILDKETQEALFARTKDTCEEIAEYLIYFACAGATVFRGIEEKTPQAFRSLEETGGLVQRLCEKEGLPDLIDVSKDLKEWLNTTGSGLWKNAIEQWQRDTGNRTQSGGLSVEEILWFNIPKTVDDFIYLTLDQKGVPLNYSKAYKGMWDIQGLEDMDAPLQYTLGRNNNPVGRGVFVSYQYHGSPKLPWVADPNSSEVNFIMNCLENAKKIFELTVFEVDLLNSLKDKGLMVTEDGLIKPTFPIYYVKGMECLDNILKEIEAPEFYKKVAESGLRLKDRALGRIYSAIGKLVDFYKEQIGRDLPDYLQPQVEAAVKDTIFQLREHIWAFAYENGYVKIPEGDKKRALGVCLYVV